MADRVNPAVLDHAVELPVLGVPVRFETNSAEILALVEETFGIWRGIEIRRARRGRRLVRVRYVLEPGDEGAGPHARLTYRLVDRWKLLLSSPGSVGFADASQREAVAYITAGLAADREHFRYGVLQALPLFLLSALDRLPIHAAAIVRGETALLLAGPSGVGKSSLAYAATRAGWQMLTDDVIWVQLRPRLRIWGLPGPLQVPVEARSLFPELGAMAGTVQADGREKIAVDVAVRGAAAVPPVVKRAGVCLLQRAPIGPPALERVSRKTVREALAERLDPGFDLFADTIGEAIDRLGAPGGWRLVLSGDPADAVPLLDAMVQEVER